MFQRTEEERQIRLKKQRKKDKGNEKGDGREKQKENLKKTWHQLED